MKNLTPKLEKVPKPRATKASARVEMADIAPAITRKRESSKRVKRVEAPANVPVEIGSSFEREANNRTRDVEEFTPIKIDPNYGEIINPNNYQETTDRIKKLEEEGAITLSETIGTDAFGTDTFEDIQREEGHKAKNIEFSTNYSDIRKENSRGYLESRRHENLKTLSDSKKERANRGWLRNIFDKISDYVAPKDLYDEDEEVEQFTKLGRQYEKEQEEKAAKEYALKYSAPDNLPKEQPHERDIDQHFPGQMAA
jgi:hypothetical protein